MDIWNTETAISKIPGLEIDTPRWIDKDISPADIAAIIQGGCASGAYMPAVIFRLLLLLAFLLFVLCDNTLEKHP